MLKYHTASVNLKIAEFEPGYEIIMGAGDILDIIA